MSTYCFNFFFFMLNMIPVVSFNFSTLNVSGQKRMFELGVWLTNQLPITFKEITCEN